MLQSPVLIKTAKRSNKRRYHGVSILVTILAGDVKLLFITVPLLLLRGHEKVSVRQLRKACLIVPDSPHHLNNGSYWFYMII